MIDNLNAISAHYAQKTNSGSELTFLKALEAHFSSIFLVGRHLFSLKSLADMQPLKAVTSSAQNWAKMDCLGELSSSLGKLFGDKDH